jgi:class 3 adenylate cyclase
VRSEGNYVNKLDPKIRALMSYPELNTNRATKFGQILADLSDWELLRINPLHFARKYNFDPSEAVDLFIHSARVGLFDFSWNMICPSCGGVEHSHDSLNELEEKAFHCSICNVDVPSDLDDQVEVSFTINPNVRKINIDPYRDHDSYIRYYSSANFLRSPELTEYVASVFREFVVVSPGETRKIGFDAEPGKMYRIISQDFHFHIFIHTEDHQDVQEQTLTINIAPKGFRPNEVNIHPGRVTLSLHSLRKKSTGIIFVLTDLRLLHKILEEYPSKMAPFLTGKMLLNNQGFRDLFRIQNLIPNLRLHVRSLTILFTDLKGSTALYDRTGDVFAYSLIQEHFKVLIDAVRKNSGAIVKTMGDAIMATFSEPHNGIQAAVDMMKAIRCLNSSLREDVHELGLKIGLHEGPALTINNEGRLDYFGQTVNIASRVQGLAQSNEIWITDSVFNSLKSNDLLMLNSYKRQRHSVSLKGIGEETLVYKYSGQIDAGS